MGGRGARSSGGRIGNTPYVAGFTVTEGGKNTDYYIYKVAGSKGLHVMNTMAEKPNRFNDWGEMSVSEIKNSFKTKTAVVKNISDSEIIKRHKARKKEREESRKVDYELSVGVPNSFRKGRGQRV